MTPAARLGAVLVLLAALFAGLIAPTDGGSVAEAAEGSGDLGADRAVVVGIPGLLWGDVQPEVSPTLAALAEDAAVADMTVRAARSRTCVLDGWATLGAGNRARYPAPIEDVEQIFPELTPEQQAEQVSALAGCGQQELVAGQGITDVRRTIERIAEDEGTRRFGAEPGSLGQSVQCSTAIGRASAVALAGPGAEVSVVDTLPVGQQAVQTTLGQCPLTTISLTDLIGSLPTLDREPGVSSEPAPLGRPRTEALAALDAALATIRDAAAALPGETLLLIAGISEKGTGRSQLHPLLALHPDLPTGYLTSSSTGRSPYVQLIDLAPTILRALGGEPTESMVGSPVRFAGSYPDIDAALAELRDLNRAAISQLVLTRPVFWLLVAIVAALVAALVLVMIWPGARRRRALCVAALFVATIPGSTYLANLVPWWRSAWPEATLAGSTIGIAAFVVVLALAAGSRASPLKRVVPAGRLWSAPAFIVAAGTALVIGTDVALGSPMELNALLGYNPIVAGRFVGLGNLSFGLLAAGALLAVAVLARGGRRVRALIVSVAGFALVALVGAPGLGRDFGGTLAIVAGLLVLGMLVTGIRMSVRRLLVVAVIAVVAVAGFAGLDYLRGPDDRTHLGRFVAQLFDGQAFTVVARKAQANVDVLTGSPVTWLLPIYALTLFLLLRRGGPLRSILGDEVAWRAGLIATAVALALGTVINDSGVAIPAISGILVVGVLIWLGLRKSAGGPPSASAGEPTPVGVNVNSRERTG